MTGLCCKRYRLSPLRIVLVGALWAGLAAGAAAQGSVAADRAALEALYDATGGDYPDVVIERVQLLGTRGARPDAAGISVTPDNRILVELAPEDTTVNPFDLNGRTLVFTPGGGGYSRSVRPVAWEDDIGQPVASGEEVQFRSFAFDFSGDRWRSFFVSQRGVVTFGEPFAFTPPYTVSIGDIAAEAFAGPTISPLYKPFLGGRRPADTQYVASRPDRAVVTWITEETEFRSNGVAPRASFQAVLHADGRIAFHYRDTAFSDGVVGLFPNDSVVKGDPILRITDSEFSGLPAHIDLLEAVIYESSTDGVIVEFMARGPIPEPRDAIYSYRVYVDTDEPYFAGTDEDLEIVWQIDVGPGAEAQARNGRLLPRESDNSIAMLANADGFRGTSIAVRAGAAEFDSNWRERHADATSVAVVELPAASTGVTDLSQPGGASKINGEVFHHRTVDVHDIACRIVDALGDEFDLFTFHSEFRPDVQWAGMDWTRYGGNVDASGIGDVGRVRAPCGHGRLKGQWSFPYWMGLVGFGLGPASDADVALFAHEFAHAWTAGASYDRGGAKGRLFDTFCQCHWRWDLHIPAAFPVARGGVGTRSLMGGRFWLDNGDGTWTPLNDFWGAGFSWLDLYLMGLADPDEVPDMFILRDARPVDEAEPKGPHTGVQETVTIEQVVAAEGRRVPTAAEAQKDFNAGFVYLVEPGGEPDPDLLRHHAEYRDKVIEHWSHVTGGRSRMAPKANAPPEPAGTLPVLAMSVGEPAQPVDVGPSFRDPDGDLLTYAAISSAPGVASVAVSGSTVAVTPRGEGTTTVTVTATDAAGSNGTATQTFAVTVNLPRARRFTDDPIVPGVTPVRAVHFTELRLRIDVLRSEAGLPPFRWTDPVLLAGVTPVRLVHVTQLRRALAEAYAAAGRALPAWTDASTAPGSTPIRATHLTELRRAVLALE